MTELDPKFTFAWIKNNNLICVTGISCILGRCDRKCAVNHEHFEYIKTRHYTERLVAGAIKMLWHGKPEALLCSATYLGNS